MQQLVSIWSTFVFKGSLLLDSHIYRITKISEVLHKSYVYFYFFLVVVTNSPESRTRQTSRPTRVCRLMPMDRDKASTPPLGQWPAGWQLHTLMVRVLVLERGGAPLSVTTTGSRYWLRSLRVKVLLRAMMPAVLSTERRSREKGKKERITETASAAGAVEVGGGFEAK